MDQPLPPPVLVEDLVEAEHRAMQHTPEDVLMARAADAVADHAWTLLERLAGGARGRNVVVLAGSGNNGGDALLAGARLAYRGASVTAVLVAATAHELGVGEVRGAGSRVIDATSERDEAARAVADADLVIDGIVGLRAKPGLRPPADALVAEISVSTPVLAVDLPSGLDADSGDVVGNHVRADVTVTFTAPKRCLVEPPAAASAGRVVVVDVGVAL